MSAQASEWRPGVSFAVPERPSAGEPQDLSHDPSKEPLLDSRMYSSSVAVKPLQGIEEAGAVVDSAVATQSGMSFGPAICPGIDSSAEREPEQPTDPEGADNAGREPWAATLGRLLGSACGAIFRRIWNEIGSRRAVHRQRGLRIVESVSMGEKRCIAIVQVDGQRFLIGAGAAGVSLLARLGAEQEFSAVLDSQAAVGPEAEFARQAESGGMKVGR